MGKRKKNTVNEAGKQVNKAGRQPSDKKLQRDGKPKKTKQENHLEHIPFRLREIMKSKDRMKKGSLKTNYSKKSFLAKYKPKDGDIPVPHFKRKKKESVKAYIQRMESETKHVLFLTENQVERKPELSADKQEQPADKGKSEKRKEYDKLRLQKLQHKKLEKQEAKLEKEMFIDNVAFGEVSMAPPTLTSKPKKAPVKPQKASKELLLNSLLGHTVASTAKPSMAKQRMMEEERQRAVEAYRLIKKQKQRQRQEEERTAVLENLEDLD
ncbi:coiled-coil domain-containing protein 137 [Aulostomus maculatus]